MAGGADGRRLHCLTLIFLCWVPVALSARPKEASFLLATDEVDARQLEVTPHAFIEARAAQRRAAELSISSAGYKAAAAHDTCEDALTFQDPVFGRRCQRWVGHQCSGYNFSELLTSSCPRACGLCGFSDLAEQVGMGCDEFPDWPRGIQQKTTCGRCTALVGFPPLRPSSCKLYCESFEHTCLQAAKKSPDACAPIDFFPCDQESNQAVLCTCGKLQTLSESPLIGAWHYGAKSTYKIGVTGDGQRLWFAEHRGVETRKLARGVFQPQDNYWAANVSDFDKGTRIGTTRIRYDPDLNGQPVAVSQFRRYEPGNVTDFGPDVIAYKHSGLELEDEVTWIRDDIDVPIGTVGVVKSWRKDKVMVEFPRRIRKKLSPRELRKYCRKSVPKCVQQLMGAGTMGAQEGLVEVDDRGEVHFQGCQDLRGNRGWCGEKTHLVMIRNGDCDDPRQVAGISFCLSGNTSEEIWLGARLKAKKDMYDNLATVLFSGVPQGETEGLNGLYKATGVGYSDHPVFKKVDDADVLLKFHNSTWVVLNEEGEVLLKSAPGEKDHPSDVAEWYAFNGTGMQLRPEVTATSTKKELFIREGWFGTVLSRGADGSLQVLIDDPSFRRWVRAEDINPSSFEVILGPSETACRKMRSSMFAMLLREAAAGNVSQLGRMVEAGMSPAWHQDVVTCMTRELDAVVEKAKTSQSYLHATVIKWVVDGLSRRADLPKECLDRLDRDLALARQAGMSQRALQLMAQGAMMPMVRGVSAGTNVSKEHSKHREVSSLDYFQKVLFLVTEVLPQSRVPELYARQASWQTTSLPETPMQDTDGLCGRTASKQIETAWNRTAEGVAVLAACATNATRAWWHENPGAAKEKLLEDKRGDLDVGESDADEVLRGAWFATTTDGEVGVGVGSWSGATVDIQWKYVKGFRQFLWMSGSHVSDLGLAGAVDNTDFGGCLERSGDWYYGMLFNPAGFPIGPFPRIRLRYHISARPGLVLHQLVEEGKWSEVTVLQDMFTLVRDQLLRDVSSLGYGIMWRTGLGHIQDTLAKASKSGTPRSVELAPLVVKKQQALNEALSQAMMSKQLDSCACLRWMQAGAEPITVVGTGTSAGQHLSFGDTKGELPESFKSLGDLLVKEEEDQSACDKQALAFFVDKLASVSRRSWKMPLKVTLLKGVFENWDYWYQEDVLTTAYAETVDIPPTNTTSQALTWPTAWIDATKDTLIETFERLDFANVTAKLWHGNSMMSVLSAIVVKAYGENDILRIILALVEHLSVTKMSMRALVKDDAAACQKFFQTSIRYHYYGTFALMFSNRALFDVYPQECVLNAARDWVDIAEQQLQVWRSYMLAMTRKDITHNLSLMIMEAAAIILQVDVKLAVKILFCARSEKCLFRTGSLTYPTGEKGKLGDAEVGIADAIVDLFRRAEALGRVVQSEGIHGPISEVPLPVSTVESAPVVDMVTVSEALVTVVQLLSWAGADISAHIKSEGDELERRKHAEVTLQQTPLLREAAIGYLVDAIRGIRDTAPMNVTREPRKAASGSMGNTDGAPKGSKIFRDRLNTAALEFECKVMSGFLGGACGIFEPHRRKLLWILCTSGQVPVKEGIAQLSLWSIVGAGAASLALLVFKVQALLRERYRLAKSVFEASHHLPGRWWWMLTVPATTLCLAILLRHHRRREFSLLSIMIVAPWVIYRLAKAFVVPQVMFLRRQTEAIRAQDDAENWDIGAKPVAVAGSEFLVCLLGFLVSSAPALMRLHTGNYYTVYSTLAPHYDAYLLGEGNCGIGVPCRMAAIAFEVLMSATIACVIIGHVWSFGTLTLILLARMQRLRNFTVTFAHGLLVSPIEYRNWFDRRDRLLMRSDAELWDLHYQMEGTFLIGLGTMFFFVVNVFFSWGRHAIWKDDCFASVACCIAGFWGFFFIWMVLAAFANKTMDKQWKEYILRMKYVHKTSLDPTEPAGDCLDRILEFYGSHSREDPGSLPATGVLRHIRRGLSEDAAKDEKEQEALLMPTPPGTIRSQFNLTVIQHLLYISSVVGDVSQRPDSYVMIFEIPVTKTMVTGVTISMGSLLLSPFVNTLISYFE